MEVDVLLFFEEFCEVNMNLFHLYCHENISIRYVIMTSSELFEKFQDFYHGMNPNIHVFCIYNWKPFHYMTFFIFLKYFTARRSVDKYIFTKSYNESEIKKILETYSNKSDTLLKLKHDDNDIVTYVMSPMYFQIFNIETSMDLYLDDCFLWKFVRFNYIV